MARTYDSYKKLDGSTLQYKDAVIFTHNGTKYCYEVRDNFMNNDGNDNAIIFDVLYLDKMDFCSKHYGYRSDSGYWPTFRNYEQLTKCVLALFCILEKLDYKESKPTLDPRIVTNDNWKPGDKVIRGRDWIYSSQDANSVYGIIISDSNEGWVRVDWIDEHGHKLNNNSYHTGRDNKYDLYFYDKKVSQSKTEISVTSSINIKNFKKNEVQRHARTISPGARISGSIIQGSSNKLTIGQRHSLNKTIPRRG